MTDIREVSLDQEQYLFIEDLGKQFIRAGDQRTATKLLAIALAWKEAPTIREPLENDPEWRQWMQDAGLLAEVVELSAYSKRVPCA